MPYSVRCKACSSAFAIPDEIWDKRVKGRIATLKCRSCKAEIHVDGTKAGVVQISAPPPPASVDVSTEQRAVREPEPFAAAAEPDLRSAAEARMSAIPAALRTPHPGSRAIDPVVAAAPIAPIATVTATSQSKGGVSTAKAGSPGIIATKASATAVNTLSHKPAAKGAREIAAPESGWSLMPPPGEVEALGSASPTTSASLFHSNEVPALGSDASAAKGAEQQSSDIVDPQSIRPGELLQDPAIDPDLWVVSFGDEDDRELTEKQIAAELAKGGITLSTIVWQEGMPEWLPISGVKKLAKLAPQPKSAPRQTKVTVATKAGTQPAKGSSPLATTRADSPAARQPAAQRQKLPSHSQLESQAGAKLQPEASVASPRAPAALVEQSPVKGPPPLVRVSERSTDDGHGKSAVPASRLPQRTAGSATTEAASAVSVPARPPVLIKRGQASLEPAAHGARTEVTDDVLTSAPDVTASNRQEEKQPGKPPAVQGTGVALSARGVNAPKQPIAGISDAAVPDLASQRSSPKQSFRPPKPVETATSLVTRTEASAGKDLLITDEDFLAMQRRFPKWALPAGILGGVAVVGAVVYAANSAPELPPLPVAPVGDTSTVLRENPANRALPKHPQPNLDALPTAAANNVSVATQEKDFARLFAQSASKTNSTFDSKAADRAAMNFMELAARCRVAPDPSGQARVVVTFSTAGQVLSVQVGSPYADTATGRCIDKALRNVKTKAFQGEPGRLPLTVPVH